MITFKAQPYTIGHFTIVHLPKEASAKLPSRGQAMVEGRVGGVPIKFPLEPDGRGSHWFALDAKLQKAAKPDAAGSIPVAIEPTKDWTEPDVPVDFRAAIDAHPELHEMWATITPLARWEWVRWTRSTNSAETRARRIEVAISKMQNGERRPCCWNRNLSTEPAVSKSGALIGPDGAIV